MTIVQLPPFDLRVIYDWMRPEAVMAARLTGATPQCWLDAAGGPIAAGSLFSTTRSSGINLPDTAGVYQSLGINTLPRTDRGLNGNGQFTNTLARLNPTVAQANTIGSVSDDDGFAGLSGSIRFPALTESMRAVQATTLSASASAIIAILVKFDDGGPPVFASATPTNAGNSFYLGLAGTTPDPTTFAVTEVGDGSGVYRVAIAATIGASTALNGVFKAPSQSTGRAFRICGYQMFAGSFLPDALVPGSSDTGGATLFASDIIHVQGVRSSNSQPEPFPGWEAVGLDNAFGGKAIVTIDRLNAAAPRFITGAGVDANNLTKLIFDTDNRFKLVVRKSGVDEVTLQTGAVASTGDKTIEWQAKPGDYGIEATGVAGDTDSDAETLPTGATTLRIGSDFGALNPFNGWIKELQILKVAA